MKMRWQKLILDRLWTFAFFPIFFGIGSVLFSTKQYSVEVTHAKLQIEYAYTKKARNNLSSADRMLLKNSVVRMLFLYIRCEPIYMLRYNTEKIELENVPFN